MPHLTASFTLAQVQQTTRPAILKSVLRQTPFGQHGTATSGNTITLTDTTRLASAEAYGDDYWNGAYLRIVTGAAAGTIRNITDYVASTGVLTFPTATSVGTADYELWKMVHPQEVLDQLDQIMTEECFVPDWAICTEVPDGDMEQNNTTDWTAGGTATLAKSTTEPTIGGKRYLSVTNAAGNDYARSSLIYIPAVSRGYHLSALVRCSSGTATLTAYDETNGAAIQSASSTSKAWTRVWFDFNSPATAGSLSVRLIGTEADAVIFWKDVCLYPLDAQDIRLPWWVKNRDHVRGVYRLLPQNGPTNDSWDPSLIGTREYQYSVQQSRFGQGAARLVVGSPGLGINGPLYIYGLRNETAWASDTEAKHIDLRWATAKLAAACYRRAMMTLTLSEGKDAGFNRAGAAWEQEVERIQRAVLEDDDANHAAVSNFVSVGRNRWGGW